VPSQFQRGMKADTGIGARHGGRADLDDLRASRPANKGSVRQFDSAF
jgi:hypothetical protein